MIAKTTDPLPGGGDYVAAAYLVLTAPLPGIRESRRIVGEYVLTAEDCLQPTRFPDRIAKSSYPVDVHNPSGVGITLKKLPPGEYHDIPYRCLVPQRIDGIVAAGRCVSATHWAINTLRLIAPCMLTGEAAGTAAALAAASGVAPRQADVAQLQSRLREQGNNLG